MDKIDEIGYGAYGNIFSVSHDGKVYALKQNIKNKRVLGSSVIREISTLILLKGHPNIVELKEVYIGNPCSNIRTNIHKDLEEDKLFFLFEIANFDLNSYIHTLNSPVRLILKIITDIALGLEYMHKMNIIHRDIKPGNILISIEDNVTYSKLCASTKSMYKSILNDIDPMMVTVKICDFGFSKRIQCDNRPITPGIVTMWYRPPEIIMENAHDEKMDVWSYGLVLYELLYCKALYETTGDDDQLELKNEIIRKRPKFDDEDRKYLRISDKNVMCGFPPFRDGFLNITPIDANRKRRIEMFVGSGELKNIEILLGKMLEIDPKNRPTIAEILDDPIFDSYRSYINKVRKVEIPKVLSENMEIASFDCRKTGYEYFEMILNLQLDVPILDLNIFFLAIDIFDRYLSKLEKEIEEDMIFICVLSCINIAYKYLASFYEDNIVVNIYKKLCRDIPSKLIYYNIENIEFKILSALDYQVYNDTLYSLVDSSTRGNVNEMFDYFKNLKPGKLEIKDVLIAYSSSFQ